MQAKWDQVIGEGMIKKNITDLFLFFPKQSIYGGDSWTFHSVQKTDIPLGIQPHICWRALKIVLPI